MGVNNLNKVIAYTLLSASFFIGFFNRFSPATFSVYIAESLDLSLTIVGGIAALHFWIYTVMQVPAGLIVDRFGIRVPAGIGTLLSGGGAITLGVASNYWMALSGSSLVGLGMSLVFVAVMKNNAIWFDGRKFGFITGLTLLIGTFGAVFSEAPALFVLQYISWRKAFILIGVATILIGVSIIVFWRYPSSMQVKKRFIDGSAFKGNDNPYSWFDIVFNRHLFFIMLAISGTNGTFYAFSGLWAPHLFGNVLEASPVDSSIIVTVSLLIYGFSSLFFGGVSDYFKTRRFFIWFFALVNFISWVFLLFFPGFGLYSAYFFFSLIGLSAGVQVVVCFAAVKESVPSKVAGSAIAFVNMGVFLTTAVIQSLYGFAVERLLSFSEVSASAYLIGLLLPIAISLLGLLASFYVHETYPRQGFVTD